MYIEYLAQFTGKSPNPTVKNYIVAFEVNVPPLSMSKFFYKEINRESDCKGKCVKVMQTENPNGDADMTIQNEHVRVNIKRGEMISSYSDKWSGIEINLPTTMYTYPGTSGQTTSGLYIFNPIKDPTKRDLKLTQRYIQKGNLLSIVHSFYSLKGTNVNVAQSITVNRCSNLSIQRSVRVTTKMNTQDYFEYTMRSDISNTFPEETTLMYVDNGADVALKQYYTFEEAKKYNFTKNNLHSYTGLNGFASIYGTAWRSTNDTFFGFVNSNSILVNPLARNHYEIMLMRNTNYYDDKGKDLGGKLLTFM